MIFLKKKKKKWDTTKQLDPNLPKAFDSAL